MGIGPIVALVLLRNDSGSTSFVLTAIGLGVVIFGIYVVSNVWKTPQYNGWVTAFGQLVATKL